jgi:adenine-specific DNA-methyltransferase
MPRKKQSSSRPIASYEHRDKERLNNPLVGLVTPETDPDAGQKKKRYAYDPHLDPQLVWAGKAEHTSFEVPTVSLHVHERIDPRTIIEAVRKRNGNGQSLQLGLFEEQRAEPLREAVEFYQHKHGWSNRLIAGDSLLVMNSLLEKEGMAGKVQMIYIDPPYGIKYGSNFQSFVNKRDVMDGRDEDLTSEADCNEQEFRLGAGQPPSSFPHEDRTGLGRQVRRVRQPPAGVPARFAAAPAAHRDD